MFEWFEWRQLLNVSIRQYQFTHRGVCYHNYYPSVATPQSDTATDRQTDIYLGRQIERRAKKRRSILAFIWLQQTTVNIDCILERRQTFVRWCTDEQTDECTKTDGIEEEWKSIRLVEQKWLIWMLRRQWKTRRWQISGWRACIMAMV